MPVRYDTDRETFVIDSETCRDCGQPLYDSGCDAPGCNGFGCQDCGLGCDRDFLPKDLSRCAAATAAEDPQERLERANKERAALGLSPLTADESEES